MFQSPVTSAIAVWICVTTLCLNAVTADENVADFALPGTGGELVNLAPSSGPTKPPAVSGNGLTPAQIQELEARIETPADDDSWYDWVIPSSWYLPEMWDNSFELGIDGSEGNASTLSFRTGANLHRKVDWSDLKIAINYVKASAQSVETKHNAQMEVNHDWLFDSSPWSIFAKTILVYDEFRPFDLEMTLNTGLGYRFIDTDTFDLKGRFGSGATRQWGGPTDNWRPEAMLGVDCEYIISARQKLRVTCDYYPQWDDFEVYRVRTDAGWEMLLDEATNMSLKLGLIDRYDSNAGGTKPNTLDYAILLLWKM